MIAAIAATVLLVLPAVYGVRSDPKIEEFLKSPGAVDKFTAAKGQNPAQKNAETSPLVKQAADFGRILNPPPPPPPKVLPGAAPQAAAVPAPPVVAAKFDLVATSYYASHPEQSFVLIDEPGKGLHWVKQGSAVGHLTIETVKDGAIIVRDGQRTSEMTVKVQELWRKLLKNPPPETQPAASTSISTGLPPPPSVAPPLAGQGRPGFGAKIPPPAAEIAPPPEEKPAPEDSPAIKEKTAKIDKLISEMKSSSDENKTDEEKSKLKKLLNMSVNEIELSVRAANCLNNANITTVGELAQKTEAEMLKYRNFGKKSLAEINKILVAMGLSLGMKIDEEKLKKAVPKPKET